MDHRDVGLALLPAGDRHDLRLGVAEQDLHQFQGRVAGGAEDGNACHGFCSQKRAVLGKPCSIERQRHAAKGGVKGPRFKVKPPTRGSLRAVIVGGKIATIARLAAPRREALMPTNALRRPQGTATPEICYCARTSSPFAPGMEVTA